MAERITITPEELRDSASKFTAKSAEIRETLSFLRNEVTVWKLRGKALLRTSFSFPMPRWSRH